VSCAGLAPVLQLAERAGLQLLVADLIKIDKPGGCNPHLKVPGLIAGMDAGADSIDDSQCVHGVGRKWTRPCFWREAVDESLPFNNVRCVPKYYDELDAVLRALADPTRRAVVERLAKSPAVVSELAAPFSMALPSLMQHLRVLETAGLVTSQKHGRVRTVSLRPGALDVLHLWLGDQRTPAERQADRLGIHLIRTTPKET